ncbi:MAG TPA: NAD-dependent epimerase, partial [Anaerolineae bacterium]|nr:NAD-dependent epimerase [Anaerolineae bacterium]
MNIQTAYFKQKALITGGLGFIGSNLARRLLELGAEVTILDNLDPQTGGNPFNIADIRDQVRLVQADINDEDNMKSVVDGQTHLF